MPYRLLLTESYVKVAVRFLRRHLELKRQYGWISVGRGGHWTIAHTTPAMTYVVMTLAGEVVASSTPKG